MVYIGEIKRDTPLWPDEEAAEMITTQNFLRVIAQIVVWAPGVNHKSDSQLWKQTLQNFWQFHHPEITYFFLPLYKHEDISLATLWHSPESHKPCVAPRPLLPPLTSHFIRPRVTRGNRLEMELHKSIKSKVLHIWESISIFQLALFMCSELYV